MPALPPASDFTTSTRTEGQVKTALTDQRAFLAGLLGVSGTAATALATLGALAGQYAALTVATTLSLADRGKLLVATGTWTLTLPTAASAGAGFAVALRNSGTGTVTIDPNGAELINGAATLAVGAGKGGVVICTGGAWLTLDPAGMGAGANIDAPVTGTGVQSALDDATAGRLMLNGGHGLGVTVSPVLLTDLDATTVPTGFYCTTTANTVAGTWPPGVAAGNGMIFIERFNASNSWQTFAPLSNFLGRWFRRYTGGVWQIWERSTPVLGAVTQVGGVPNGAILERGANANGEYVRYADGTLICTRTDLSVASASVADGGLFRAGSVAWTFPSAFIAAPVVTGAVDDIDCWLSVAAPTTTNVLTRVKSSVTKAVALGYRATAVGRWF